MNDGQFYDTPQTDFSNDCQVHWSSLSFRDLEAAYHRTAQPGDPKFALTIRYENIMNFVESDRMWPPTAPIKDRFVPVFCEVLSRLPADVFRRVEDETSIILEMHDLQMLAINVPGPHCAPSGRCPNTIVFFHPCWELSSKALVGLVAHEVAHSFVAGEDYQSDETHANQQAMDWGFGEELRLLRKEKDEKLSARP